MSKAVIKVQVRFDGTLDARTGYRIHNNLHDLIWHSDKTFRRDFGGSATGTVGPGHAAIEFEGVSIKEVEGYMQAFSRSMRKFQRRFTYLYSNDGAQPSLTS